MVVLNLNGTGDSILPAGPTDERLGEIGQRFDEVPDDPDELLDWDGLFTGLELAEDEVCGGVVVLETP